jgi:HrpA-like RNA helicase
VGVPLASLPLDPCLGKCLLAAAGCAAQEFLAVAAMLTVPSIWAHQGSGEKRALEEAQAKFAVAEGDLATYLNVYEAWVANGRSQKW